MKKKRLLAAAVVLLMLLVSFAGCGKSSTKETNKTSKNSKTEIIKTEESENTSSDETVSEETNNTADNEQNNTTVSNTGSVYGTVLLSMLNNPLSKALNTYGLEHSYYAYSGKVSYPDLGLLFYLPEYPASFTGNETVVGIDAKGSFDIGNGFTANMTADQIRSVVGNIPDPSYLEINDTYIISVSRGGYGYVFSWEGSYNSRPCDFVSISKR